MLDIESLRSEIRTLSNKVAVEWAELEKSPTYSPSRQFAEELAADLAKIAEKLPSHDETRNMAFKVSDQGLTAFWGRYHVFESSFDDWRRAENYRVIVGRAYYLASRLCESLDL